MMKRKPAVALALEVSGLQVLKRMLTLSVPEVQGLQKMKREQRNKPIVLGHLPHHVELG